MGNNQSSQNDAFADYLTEVTKHFRDSWGVTFRTLEPLNEPNATWWCGPGVTTADVIQWASNGGTNQQWQIVP